MPVRGARCWLRRTHTAWHFGSHTTLGWRTGGCPACFKDVLWTQAGANVDFGGEYGYFDGEHGDCYERGLQLPNYIRCRTCLYRRTRKQYLQDTLQRLPWAQRAERGQWVAEFTVSELRKCVREVGGLGLRASAPKGELVAAIQAYYAPPAPPAPPARQRCGGSGGGDGRGGGDEFDDVFAELDDAALVAAADEAECAAAAVAMAAAAGASAVGEGGEEEEVQVLRTVSLEDELHARAATAARNGSLIDLAASPPKQPAATAGTKQQPEQQPKQQPEQHDLAAARAVPKRQTPQAGLHGENTLFAFFGRAGQEAMARTGKVWRSVVPKQHEVIK